MRARLLLHPRDAWDYWRMKRALKLERMHEKFAHVKMYEGEGPERTAAAGIALTESASRTRRARQRP